MILGTTEVANALRAAFDDAREVRAEFPVDVRLQVEPLAGGSVAWRILWGDPSFDLDHRGHWGFAELGAELSEHVSRGAAQSVLMSELRSIACDLIQQVDESIAQASD